MVKLLGDGPELAVVKSSCQGSCVEKTLWFIFSECKYREVGLALERRVTLRRTYN